MKNLTPTLEEHSPKLSTFLSSIGGYSTRGTVYPDYPNRLCFNLFVDVYTGISKLSLYLDDNNIEYEINDESERSTYHILVQL